jgi:hypothetical protein
MKQTPPITYNVLTDSSYGPMKRMYGGASYEWPRRRLLSGRYLGLSRRSQSYVFLARTGPIGSRQASSEQDLLSGPVRRAVLSGHPQVASGQCNLAHAQSRPIPASRARISACALAVTCSLTKMLETWFLIVFTLTNSCPAIS